MAKCKRCGGTGTERDSTRIGVALRNKRKAAKKSLRDVAKSVGISAAYLQQMEVGERRITREREAQIKQAIEAKA